MTEMDQYRMAVKDYAANNTPYLFHNQGDEHALIILTNLFINAKEHIRIAANKLYNDEVVNTKEYIDSMRSFLDRNDTKLSILITKRPSKEEIKKCPKENTFYWMLFNHPAYYQGRVEIKEGNGKSFHDKDGQQVNFCTGDDLMYRLENAIVERKAIANFGDREMTGKLIKAFDNSFPNNLNVELKDFYTE